MRYLPVNVYSCQQYGDCSANGVTATHTNKLVVECPTGHMTKADVTGGGYVVLQLRTTGGAANFRPEGNDKRHAMFGGAFVRGDSRFSELYGRQPVAVHDRFES